MSVSCWRGSRTFIRFSKVSVTLKRVGTIDIVNHQKVCWKFLFARWFSEPSKKSRRVFSFSNLCLSGELLLAATGPPAPGLAEGPPGCSPGLTEVQSRRYWRVWAEALAVSQLQRSCNFPHSCVWGRGWTERDHNLWVLLGEPGKMPRPTGAASCLTGSKPRQGASAGNLREASVGKLDIALWCTEGY